MSQRSPKSKRLRRVISNGLFGEFGLLDILVLINYFEAKKSNKLLNRMQKLQIYAVFFGDEELKEILEEIREWKRKSETQK